MSRSDADIYDNLKKVRRQLRDGPSSAAHRKDLRRQEGDLVARHHSINAASAVSSAGMFGFIVALSLAIFGVAFALALWQVFLGLGLVMSLFGRGRLGRWGGNLAFIGAVGAGYAWLSNFDLPVHPGLLVLIAGVVMFVGLLLRRRT